MEVDHSKYQFDTITDEVRKQQPFYREDYQEEFPRESLTRRVLSFISNEHDARGVQHNTPEQVARVLISDGEAESQEQVEAEFDKLHEAGFIEHNDDGTYERTKTGWIELSN